MKPEETKQLIRNALAAFGTQSLEMAAKGLFNTLGYASDRDPGIQGVGELDSEVFKRHEKADEIRKRADLEQWKDAALLFQLTDEEVRASGQARLGLFKAGQYNAQEMFSYLFMAVELKKTEPSRTWLAQVTRAVNRAFAMPVIIAFKHADRLSIAIIDRRPGKVDRAKDVLEKVTLIKDIRISEVHRAHLEILYDLSLPSLASSAEVHNFNELHDAWRKALDQQELNKKFYRDIANWYFWAMDKAKFPKDAPENSVSLIRLITRLIFCWFIKEKGLIPDELFEEATAKKLLKSLTPKDGDFYQAILQNLFFATLNAPMSERKFINLDFKGSVNQAYMVSGFWRYRDQIADEDAFLALFKNIPYMNGGLFECLDYRDEKNVERRIDGFSSTPKSRAHIPNELFFGAKRQVDLGKEYGTGSKKETVSGLIEILSHYKFTVAENTPLEVEVALDPELLGQVFENLLASYNPETGTTARKKTGSFYTPRPVVDFMVEQALLKRWSARLADLKMAKPDTEARLKLLLSYGDQSKPFDDAETKALISILDTTKVLDPACGSGAFPMGVLHRMVRVLAKLDPHNQLWKEKQLETIENSDLGPDIKDEYKAKLKATFEENDDDYGRKLYLIQNCIYGVDIQAIAVQIAKLRCFISLVVDQKVDNNRPNRGVLELPNLETRFVAANTLNGIQGQIGLKSSDLEAMERELSDVRAKHFKARRYEQKKKLRERDRELSKKIGEWLKENHMLNKEEAGSLVSWNPYDQNASATTFDPEWMFGPEFAMPRFDVVVGNPPYVRHEKIRELKPRLEELYGKGTEADVFTGTADLYVYFYARSLLLLAPGGVISFISSNKYFRSGYGNKLRGYLAREAKIDLIIDFGDVDVFEGTIAYPSILVAEKGRLKSQMTRVLPWDQSWNEQQFQDYFNEKSFEVPQKDFREDGWRFENPTIAALFDKVKNAGMPLGEYVRGRFYNGVKTGLNNAYVVDEKTKDKLIAEHKSSKDVLKPYLRGRDIKRWKVRSPKLWLIYIPWHFPLHRDSSIVGASTAAEAEFKKSYPAIYSHLKKFKTELVARDKTEIGIRYEWYALSRPRPEVEEAFGAIKIICPAIIQRASYAFDDEKYFTNNKTTIIVVDDFFVLGLLNSKVVDFVMHSITSTKQGGYYEYQPMYLTQLPIYKIDSKNKVDQSRKAEISECVRKMVNLRSSGRAKDVSEMVQTTLAGLENNLDRLVFELYGLSAAEIQVIENSFKSSTSNDAKTALRDGVVTPLAKEFAYFKLEAVRDEAAALELDLTDESIGKYLTTMAEEATIYDAGRGWYSRLPEAAVLDQRPLEPLVKALKGQFPMLDFSCWALEQLNAFAQHLFAKQVFFLSINEAGLEAVAEFLDSKGYSVYSDPHSKDAKKLNLKDQTVILRPKAAKDEFPGPFAPIEKVIFDLFLETETLGIVDGSEYQNILRNILENKRISVSGLFSYIKSRTKTANQDKRILEVLGRCKSYFSDFHKRSEK